MATLYLVLYANDFDGVAPSVTQVKGGQDPSGSPAIWTGSITSPEESGTFDWPTVVSGLGLSGGDSLCYSLVWSDGSDNSDVSQSSVFFVDAPVVLDFDLQPKHVSLSRLDSQFAKSTLLVLDQGQFRVQGFNTADKKGIVLNLEPKALAIARFPSTNLRDYVLNLEPKAVVAQGLNTTGIRSSIFVLESKNIVVQGYNTDAGTELVFPLDNKQCRIQGSDLEMLSSKSLDLQSGTMRVSGFPGNFSVTRLFSLEPDTVSLDRFNASLIVDRVLPVLAKEMLVQGYSATFIAQRFLSLNSRQLRLQRFSASFGGSYVYPESRFVKYGVTYGPSGSDFVGSFTFKPSFDVMTGAFVLPDTYRTFDFGIESNLTVLTPELVAEGVIFGIDQVGTSKGYLSYDVNTARIARPVSDNALVVV